MNLIEMGAANYTDISSPTQQYIAETLSVFFERLVEYTQFNSLGDCTVVNQETVNATMTFLKDLSDGEEAAAYSSGVKSVTSIVGAINQCEEADSAEVKALGLWIYRNLGNK